MVRLEAEEIGRSRVSSRALKAMARSLGFLLWAMGSLDVGPWASHFT